MCRSLESQSGYKWLSPSLKLLICPLDAWRRRSEVDSESLVEQLNVDDGNVFVRFFFKRFGFFDDVEPWSLEVRNRKSVLRNEVILKEIIQISRYFSKALWLFRSCHWKKVNLNEIYVSGPLVCFIIPQLVGQNECKQVILKEIFFTYFHSFSTLHAFVYFIVKQQFIWVQMQNFSENWN